MEKVMLYVTQLEGALKAVWQEYPTMKVSMSDVQEHLRDCFFHGLCKQLCKSMHYLYNGMGITYLQLIIAANKAGSEQED